MKLHFQELIVFENDDFLLINKPSHIASLDERNSDKPLSILRLAKSYYTDVQLCHRLDKETSGILAIAKHPAAYRHLALQFEHRQVTKRYHAIVNGIHDLDNISVYLPIAPIKDGTAVRIDRTKGKEAETIFNTLKVYRNHTLVECIPITGRMHQIRVHLMCLKAPIVNDPTYSGKSIFLSELKRNFHLKKGTEELPLIQRVALHARSLAFTLLSNERVEFDAPYPKDFEVLLKQLEKYP